MTLFDDPNYGDDLCKLCPACGHSDMYFTHAGDGEVACRCGELIDADQALRCEACGADEYHWYKFNGQMTCPCGQKQLEEIRL